jgi:ubiquinone/menaquinone biosynthesis C-methylase UbiE
MNPKQLSWEQAVQWLKSQPDKQELVCNCYYDDPLWEAAERFSASEEWLTVAKLLSAYIPGSVLDIGAGRGISSYAFAKSGCNVTALEPDPSSIVGSNAIQELTEKTHLPIQIVQEYGETLPFSDNTFDIVYGRAVLHHAKNLDQLCQEAARVLKHGGVFLATREHVISSKADLQSFFDSHALHYLYGGENAFLLAEYESAIQSSGLKLKRSFSNFESAINYAPMTQESLRTFLGSRIERFLDKKLANAIVSFKPVQSLLIWYISRVFDKPGRHYSFLAIKP